MHTFRTAIVGCGPRAYWHARAYRWVERGEPVACCARNTERRQVFAEAFGIKGYADAVEMLRQEKPDLVHLVTPPHTRVELMTMVHEEEVPACIVEKPIAYEVRDWKALVRLQSETQTKFGVGAQFRYHPDLIRCREALQSGHMGQLLFLDCSAVGTICDQGVHVIDWAMSLNNNQPVVRVFGTASGRENMTHHRHPSPDTTMAQLVFANGVIGMWNLGNTAPRVVNDPAYFKHCRVAAYAELGRTLYEEFGRWEILAPHGITADQVADMQAWEAGNHAAQANLTNAMLDWIEDDGKPVGTHLKRALEQWNVVLGLYASALTRQPVDLPFEPPDDLWDKLAQTLN